MKFLLLFILSMTSAEASTKLLLIGGGARPPEAMQTFVQASGGEKANILICSWASATTEGADNIRSEIELSHPHSITILPTFPMKSDDESKVLKLLETATGVFFTGGDQTQLMLAIQSQKLKEKFKEAYQNGIAFAGTSAGTAIMSERMITGDTTPLAEGLGLLPTEIIVDQHFIVRQRFERLSKIVLQSNNTFGLGIDEGTALYILNSRTARVIGPSEVVLFSKETDRKVSLEFFKENELFNLFGLKQ
jgi:cyanophycinase